MCSSQNDRQRWLACLIGLGFAVAILAAPLAGAEEPEQVAQTGDPEPQAVAPDPPAEPDPAAEAKPTPPPESGIEEIIVRGGESEAASDFGTADSVTGFGAEDLAALGVQDIADLAAFTPNLEIVTAGATTPTFFIRGVGLNDFNSNSTGAVAIYQDEVAINAPALQLSTLFDIEAVNVLRGPQGTGLLFIAEGVEITPLMVGGTGGQSSGPDQPAVMPERFESGTLNTPGIAGLKAGVEFLRETGQAAVRKKETDLARSLLEGLRGIPGITVHGPLTAEERCSVVSFTVAGFDPARIGFHLDRDYSISVRVGLHCAYSAHKTIGTYPEGTVRVSPGYFNTDDDIEAFLKAVHAIVTGGK